jgi:hypothetical protein
MVSASKQWDFGFIPAVGMGGHEFSGSLWLEDWRY